MNSKTHDEAQGFWMHSRVGVGCHYLRRWLSSTGSKASQSQVDPRQTEKDTIMTKAYVFVSYVRKTYHTLHKSRESSTISWSLFSNWPGKYCVWTTHHPTIMFWLKGRLSRHLLVGMATSDVRSGASPALTESGMTMMQQSVVQNKDELR